MNDSCKICQLTTGLTWPTGSLHEHEQHMCTSTTLATCYVQQIQVKGIRCKSSKSMHVKLNELTFVSYYIKADTIILYS